MKRGRKPKPSSNWHHKDGSNPPSHKTKPKSWLKPKPIKCKERGESHDWELREDASTFEVERFRCSLCGWWARRYTSAPDQKTPIPYRTRVPSGQKSQKVMDTVVKPDETWSKADLLYYSRNAKI